MEVRDWKGKTCSSRVSVHRPVRSTASAGTVHAFPPPFLDLGLTKENAVRATRTAKNSTSFNGAGPLPPYELQLYRAVKLHYAAPSCLTQPVQTYAGCLHPVAAAVHIPVGALPTGHDSFDGYTITDK